MPVYYPAVAVRLVVRFDEALLTGSTMPAPTLPEDNAAKPVGAPGGPSDKPALLNGAKDRLSHTLIMIPKTASIELPSYRQAPKFTLTFAFRDFPIDPRAMRAMSAEIFVGVVNGSDFARGMLGQKAADGRLASQLTINRDNLMLVGTVDNMTMEHGERGSDIKLDGRGLQGLLLDAKIHADQLAKLDVNKPINEVVAQLLGMDAQGSKIPVRVNNGQNGTPNEWANGVPAPSDPAIVNRTMKGATGAKSNLPMKGDPNSVGVWDVITNLCFFVGAVPYFIANELWIRPARSIFDQKNAGYPGTGDTPFNGPNGQGKKRTLKLAGKSVDVSFRKMIYGKNLLNFKIERKFAGAVVPVVQCVAYDDTKVGALKHIEAQWPPKGDKALVSKVDPSGMQTRSEPMRIPVHGIVDKTRLELIAKQIYEEVGRGEMGGSASSKDLASLGGDNADADIIRLRPGDAVEFAVDAAGLQGVPPVVSELNNNTSQSPQQLSQSIQTRLGLDKDLADVLVGTARGKFQGLQNVFRTANVKYAWAIESGIGVDFDFQNYVTARYDVQNNSQQTELGDFTSAPTNAYGSSSTTGAA